MRIAFVLFAASPLLTSSAFGWGCEGHQIVALIARAHLTPAASAAVDRLLRDNPIDPSLTRFCKDRPNDMMADSATWADDARKAEDTAEWHYIDIPLAVQALSTQEPDWTQWCAVLAGGKAGCVVTAINYEWGILRDENQPPEARARALRYLIHFLGDMEQPLHASDNHDRGGNCTSIRFFAIDQPQNLHGIWDYQLVAHELAANHQTQTRYAQELDKQFAQNWHAWGESAVDLPAWIWESHNFAATVAYADLNPQIPTEPAAAGQADEQGCNAERDKVAALHIRINDAYVAQATPVIREQLAKGGYHLASLLNKTFN